MTDPRHFCVDCEVDTIDRARPWDYYMVCNELWLRFGVGKNMLCLGCFTQRLGRPLEAFDFTLAPINRINPLVRVLVGTPSVGALETSSVRPR